MSGKEYRTITDVKGPLVFLEKTEPVAYNEIVQLRLSDGTMKNGQVLDTSDDQVIVQVFEGTESVDRQTGVKFLGDVFRLPVSKGLIGRILDGAGKPRDGGPEIVAEEMADIIGAAINPYSRESPEQFIQTGISAIDACTSLVRGQKLPIFSASGLPHNDIALQIARQAKLVGSDDDFVVGFCAMGITAEEYNFFVHDLERTGAMENAVLFVNLADDPAVERLITPRLALTAAEYLAFEHDYHVLVIYTDMTNYCESLRQIGAAREEVPGRRG